MRKVKIKLVILISIGIIFLRFRYIWSEGFQNKYGSESLTDIFISQYVIESVSNGFLPLWNPYHNAGYPFYINILTMQFTITQIIMGIIVSFLNLLKTDINIYKCTLFLNLVYLIILFFGIAKLISLFVRDSKIAIFLGIIGTLAIGNNVDTHGLYITSNSIYCFTPYAFFYLIELIEGRFDNKSIIKFILFYILMLAHQGLYSVPISLQLFTLAILLIFKNYKKILRKLINIKLNIFFIRAFVFLVIIIILISPYIYVAYFEVDNIVRTGRNLSKFNWSNFLEASQGIKGLVRFNYFSTRISSNHPPIFYFGISSFFFAVVGFFSSSKRYLYLKCFFLFCFTVFLHEYSVFLNLYYNFLFPYLTKIAYWGVLYDNLVFFYLIFIGLGFEIFMKMINNNRSLDYKLYLIVTISILIYLVGVEFYTAIPWILFCLIFLLNSIRFIFNKKISSLFLLLLLVEQIIYIGFYSQKWLMSSFQNDPSFYRTGENIKGYEFHNNREIKRSALDAHGFFPLINRRDYFWMGENSPFVQYKNSFNLIERFKDKPRILFQLFGVDSDIIEITTNVKIVNNEKELWENLNQNFRYPIIINGISPRKQLCESESNLHYIENIKLRPGRLLIKLYISTCAYLIWRESYHPDWQVHIDESVNEILKVDGNFMGVYLERPGFHTITFHFYPKYFIILFVFSILLQSVLIFYFSGLLIRKNFI